MMKRISLAILMLFNMQVASLYSSEMMNKDLMTFAQKGICIGLCGIGSFLLYKTFKPVPSYFVKYYQIRQLKRKMNDVETEFNDKLRTAEYYNGLNLSEQLIIETANLLTNRTRKQEKIVDNVKRQQKFMWFAQEKMDQLDQEYTQLQNRLAKLRMK